MSDGTGRDSYVVDGTGGFAKKYTIGHVNYPKDWLRNEKKYPYQTPVMDSRFRDSSMFSHGSQKYMPYNVSKLNKRSL